MTKTHCKRGHALIDSNLYVNPSGHRFCQTCRVEYAARYRREHGLTVFGSPEHKERLSVIRTAMWQREDFRRNHKKAYWSPEQRRRVAERCRGSKASETTLEKRSAATQARWDDPAEHATWARSIRRAVQRPDYREQALERVRRRWNTPCEYKRGRLSILMHSWWEVAFAEWLDRSGIDWQYEPRRFYLSNGAYIPDFYIPAWRCFVEVKGFEAPRFKGKIEAMRKAYPDVQIVLFDRQALEALGVVNDKGRGNLSKASARRKASGAVKAWPAARLAK